MSTLLSYFNQLPDWAFQGVFPFLSLIVLLILRLLYRRLDRRSRQKNSWFQKALIASTRLPLTLFWLSGVLHLIPDVYDLSRKLQGPFGFSAKLMAGFGIAFFLREILFLATNRLLTEHPSLQTSSGLLRSIVTVLVFSVMLIALLEAAGISVTPFVASLGIGSVAIALALQDTLKSLFSGFYIILDQPIRVGDLVRIDAGIEGVVEQISWRSTRLKTLTNNILIIPNAKVVEAVLLNFSRPQPELVVTIDVGVAYDADLTKVEQVTLEVAKKVMSESGYGVASSEPAVRYHTLGDFSVVFTVALRAKSYQDQSPLKHAFIKALLPRYQQEKIEIPYPTNVTYQK